MSRIFDVIVVEDEPKILQNVIDKVQTFCPRFRVVGNAFNGRDAVTLMESLSAHLLITDIRMPLLDGLALISWINSNKPRTKVIILTGHEDFQYARQAIQLQVADFLLKPISGPTLKKALDRVASTLDDTYQAEEQRFFQALSTGQGSLGLAKPSDLFPVTTPFSLFLMNLGNLAAFERDQTEPRVDAWSNLGLPSEIEALSPTGQGWITDEPAHHQKLVILREADRRPSTDKLATGEALIELIQGRHQNLPVTLCFAPANVTRASLYETTLALRHQMKQRLVPCRSQAFAFDAVYTLPEIPDPANNQILKAIQTGNRSDFQRELASFLIQAEQKAVPQRPFEKALLNLLACFGQYDIVLPDMWLEESERQLAEILSQTSDRATLNQKISEVFYALFTHSERTGHNASRLVEEIYAYLAQNFSNEISFDSLAKRFNISPVYLTRAFKRYRNETPLKSLIILRIEEAKNLMKNGSKLDVKDVAPLVGYQDQHYFSRIFKSVTGMSPTEFRRKGGHRT